MIWVLAVVLAALTILGWQWWASRPGRRRTVRHWLILHLLRDGSVHVIPDDRRTHIEDPEGTCPCGPRVDHFGSGWFIEHRSLSGHGAIRR